MNATDRLKELFDAERGAALPAEQAARGWERLASAVAENVTPMSVAVGPLGLGYWTAAKVIGVTLLTGAVVTGGVGAASAWRHHAAADTAESSVAGAASEPVPRQEGAVAPDSSTEAVADSVQPAASASASSTGAPTGSASSTFEQELKLIELAKRELDRGEPHLAEVWLEEHRTRFPNGSFAGERDGLLVLLACARATSEQRRDLAERFLRTHAGSPLTDRIRRACRVEPVSPASRPKAATAQEQGEKPASPLAASAKSFPPEIGK